MRQNYLVESGNFYFTAPYKYLLFLCFLTYTNLNALSIVYHFRIAQITKQPIFEHIDTKYTLIALVFDQVLKTYQGDIQKNFAGDLDAFIYNFKPYYFRTDFAFAYVTENIKHVPTYSSVETDDILFTVGRNFILDNAKVTLSGLFGVPTHKNGILQHPQLAFAQFGTGIQLDGTYKFNNKNSVIWGLRSVYFIPRNALDDFNRKHIFTIGTLSDILISYRHDWAYHDLEIGFTERFQLGARIHPNLDNTIEKTNYIRSSFYIAYKYKFFINNIQNRITFEAAYSFDNTPKRYGYQYVIIGWVTWNVAF